MIPCRVFDSDLFTKIYYPVLRTVTVAVTVAVTVIATELSFFGGHFFVEMIG